MFRLEAYFDNICDARKAAGALNDAGYGNVHLDMAGACDYEFASEMDAFSGDTPGLSSLAFRSSDHLFNPDKAIYMSPGTSIAGIGCPEDCMSLAAKLHIRLDEKDAEKVRRIINENGGRLMT